MLYIKKVVNEVVNAVGKDTKKLDFSNHPIVSENNYGVDKVTQNHRLPIMTPGYNQIAGIYHWFRKKIYSGNCYLKKVEGMDQKANMFIRDIKGDILLHTEKLFYGWYVEPFESKIYMAV